jgi:hypothetical protein
VWCQRDIPGSGQRYSSSIKAEGYVPVPTISQVQKKSPEGMASKMEASADCMPPAQARVGKGYILPPILICERINSLNDGVKKGSKTELDGA